MSWYCYDLAASVSFLEHQPELDELVAGWLAGYHRIGRLDAADLGALPSLVMLRRLQLLAWTASHADTAMARSVRADFAEDTAAVAERYLRGRLLGGIS
jgi:Ser/Thr protein kinase RdoA (MazF antagonist)